MGIVVLVADGASGVVHPNIILHSSKMGRHEMYSHGLHHCSASKRDIIKSEANALKFSLEGKAESKCTNRE